MTPSHPPQITTTAPDAGAHPAVPTVDKAPALRATAARDRLVLLSMVAVSLALSAMFYVQFGFSGAEALFAGATVLTSSLGIHGLGQKHNEIVRLQAELARLEAARPQSAKAANGGNAPTQPAQQAAPAADVTPGDAFAKPSKAASPPRARPPTILQPAFESESAARAPLAIEPHARWENSPSPPRGSAAGLGELPELRVPSDMTAARDKSQPPPPSDAALWPGTKLSATDPMQDQWAFRPRDVAALPSHSASSRRAHPATVPAPMPVTIETDLALVQRKIKALADEVNAAEIGRVSDIGKSKPAVADSSRSAASALNQSIDVLKATAATMREVPPLPVAPVAKPGTLGDLFIPATAQPIAVSAPAQSMLSSEPATAPIYAGFDFAMRPVPPAATAPSIPARQKSARLAAITGAIEAGRIDVRLAPIVGLATHEVSHYDLSFQLKTPSGDMIDDPEADLELAGSDLLALFDTARLVRASAMADRLDARRKGGSLLSPVAGPSITNSEFLDTFARIFEERESISSQLVLTFSQGDIEQFSTSAWQALSDMHSFGFRFALDNVDHLSTDFAVLAQRGFTFVKLSAGALLNGMPTRDRFILSGEICHILAGAGLTVVAGAIDDEAVRARVFGFGILFGQGQLFGAPRQVSVDVPGGGQSAAA